MEKFIERLNNLDRIIFNIEMGFCFLILIAMVGIVGLNVFLRYIFKSPLIAAMNMATMMLVWITFFGASAIYTQKGHIALTFLIDRFPEKIGRIINILILILIEISLVWTVIETVSLMKLQWAQQIVALGIPHSILSIPIFIALILMFLTTFRYIVIESAAIFNR